MSTPLSPTLEPIRYFQDEYHWLSNFGYGSVPYGQLVFLTNENFYQAMKTTDQALREQMAPILPAQAKRVGQELELRPDWASVKDQVMMFGLSRKFQDGELRRKLLSTQGRFLIEGNNWHDTYWGVCDGKCKKPHSAAEGKNMLGYLLMRERDGIWPEDLTSGQIATMFYLR